jgi:RNA polymerase sigma factor (TIGR02999 family)
MEASEQKHVTALLGRVRAGDEQAGDLLLDLVYHELRGLASAIFRSQSPNRTLQPTALVHEAWIKMAGNLDSLESRRHFMAVAARAMRQVLTDYARGAQAQKRGGGAICTVMFDEHVHDPSQTSETRTDDVDLVALEQAMSRLADLDSRLCHIVELRLLGTMTMQEIADQLQTSKRTVEDGWTFARIWLSQQLAHCD